MDNTNFKIGKFRAIKGTNEGGHWSGGGSWLGLKFYESINRKPFSV
jgi:hypothetical protein